jgi:hypothetical protein
VHALQDPGMLLCTFTVCNAIETKQERLLHQIFAAP